MDSKSLVSVIIPTHNRPLFLKRTIQAILDQTYSHFELIVISNGINAENKAVVEGFLDPRLIYLDQENSGGPASPRNTGMKQAKGEYIAFCDDDDVWMQDKLQKQIEVMKQNPDCGLCYTNMLRFNDEREWFHLHEQGAATLRSLLYVNTVPISSVLVKTSILKNMCEFNESKAVGTSEDYELLLRLAARTKFYHVDEHLIKYWSGEARATQLDHDRNTMDTLRYFRNIFYCYWVVYRRAGVSLTQLIGPSVFQLHLLVKMLGYSYLSRYIPAVGTDKSAC